MDLLVVFNMQNLLLKLIHLIMSYKANFFFELNQYYIHTFKNYLVFRKQI